MNFKNVNLTAQELEKLSAEENPEVRLRKFKEFIAVENDRVLKAYEIAKQWNDAARTTFAYSMTNKSFQYDISFMKLIESFWDGNPQLVLKNLGWERKNENN